MEFSFVQLMDLPDEILMIILKKLDNVDVLYSLMDVNTRLNQIVHDPIFTTKIMLMKPIDQTLIQGDILLDRFCSQILPKIHHKIKWLKLQSASTERILLAGDYPNLCQLDIFIIHNKPAIHFSGKNSNFHPFNHRIIKKDINFYYIVNGIL